MSSVSGSGLASSKKEASYHSDADGFDSEEDADVFRAYCEQRRKEMEAVALAPATAPSSGLKTPCVPKAGVCSWKDVPTTPGGGVCSPSGPAVGSSVTVTSQASDVPNTLCFVRELGHGSYGRVWEVENEEGFRKALKVVDLNKCPSPDVKTMLASEPGIHAEVAHLVAGGGVVSVSGYKVSLHSVFMEMELCPLGDLRRVLDASTSYGIDESVSGRYLAQAAQVLALMHQAGIVHRDVKPENILLGDTETVKLADFGVARRTGLGAAVPRVGTLGYIPPDGEDGPSHDVWSLGIVAHELLFGEKPALLRAGYDKTKVTREVASLWDGFFEGVLALDPSTRFTAQQALDYLKQNRLC